MTDDEDIEARIKEQYGDMQPFPSARAFEAYVKIAEYGRKRSKELAESSSDISPGMVREDVQFVRDAVAGLSPPEMLAVTKGLHAYKMAMAKEQSEEPWDGPKPAGTVH